MWSVSNTSSLSISNSHDESYASNNHYRAIARLAFVTVHACRVFRAICVVGDYLGIKLRWIGFYVAAMRLPS